MIILKLQLPCMILLLTPSGSECSKKSDEQSYLKDKYLFSYFNELYQWFNVDWSRDVEKFLNGEIIRIKILIKNFTNLKHKNTSYIPLYLILKNLKLKWYDFVFLYRFGLNILTREISPCLFILSAKNSINYPKRPHLRGIGMLERTIL